MCVRLGKHCGVRTDGAGFGEVATVCLGEEEGAATFSFEKCTVADGGLETREVTSERLPYMYSNFRNYSVVF